MIELLSYFFEVVQETLDWTMGQEYELWMGESWPMGEDVNVKDMTVKQLIDINARCINVRYMQPNELLEKKIHILLDNNLLRGIKQNA